MKCADCGIEDADWMKYADYWIRCAGCETEDAGWIRYADCWVASFND